MSVYVDDIQPTGPYKNPKWPYPSFCHLMADSLDELHLFASRLMLRKAWFQNHSRYPHYDLTENKRREAVLLGAIEKTPIELIKYFKEKRTEAGK
jgi:hypothetical protein